MGDQPALESMVSGMTAERQARWQGKRVFLTGHTGFKGAWLALWLKQWGAEVYGYSLAPREPSLFQQAALGALVPGAFNDVRDPGALTKAVGDFKPDIVYHLAAQALVRTSYAEPVETYGTNVMGTVNLLEAVRLAGGVKAVVCITSDKCYENKEWVWGYRETDRLGGRDPYSNSKACAELVAQAYRSSYFSGPGAPLLATVRAGNVIGGGDWAKDRLVPDAMRAFAARTPLVIRYPAATRPWQHVLEAVSGYMALGEAMLASKDGLASQDGLAGQEGERLDGAWNFGPLPQAFGSVESVVKRLVALWGAGAEWRCEPVKDWHEAGFLTLDVTKAMRYLPWQPKLALDAALAMTVDWYKAQRDGKNMLNCSVGQIKSYAGL